MHVGVRADHAVARGEAITAFSALEGRPLVDPGWAVLSMLHMSYLRAHLYASLLEEQVEDSGTRLLVTLRLVAPDAAPPGHATQELIARAIGVADWPAVVATLESTRQEVRRFWVQVTGEQDG